MFLPLCYWEFCAAGGGGGPMGEEREGGKKASEAGEESSPAACNTPATAIGGVAAEIGPGDVRNDTRFVHGVDTYFSDSLT